MSTVSPPTTTDRRLPKMSAPAARALAKAGVHRLDDLADFRVDDLLILHGMGPKLIDRLGAVLAEHGLSFRPDAP